MEQLVRSIVYFAVSFIWTLNEPSAIDFKVQGWVQGSRFKVQGSLLFVTYTIIQGIIGSEMLVRTGPLNGKCKKEK